MRLWSGMWNPAPDPYARYDHLWARRDNCGSFVEEALRSKNCKHRILCRIVKEGQKRVRIAALLMAGGETLHWVPKSRVSKRAFSYKTGHESRWLLCVREPKGSGS